MVTPEQRMARNIAATLIEEYLTESDAETAEVGRNFTQDNVRSELAWLERRLAGDLPL